MKLFTGLAAVAATFVSVNAVSAATVDQGVGYALSASGRSIFRIDDLNAPVVNAAIQLTENGSRLEVDAIAYRPNTDGFYAYQNATNTVYEFDIKTGAATAVQTGSGNVETTTRFVGFDFNNQVDAARIVSANEENLVFFPAGSVGSQGGTPRPGSLERFTDLFYVPSDANAGADPTIVANAYTNAVPQFIGSTQQYVIDSGLDILATLANNSGELRTIGQLVDSVSGQVLDLENLAGFDILSPSEGDNLGIALFNIGGGSTLYSFDLSTTPGPVQATFLGGGGSGLRSFMVVPVAPVPLPASALLVLGGLGALGAVRRKRRT